MSAYRGMSLALRLLFLLLQILNGQCDCDISYTTVATSNNTASPGASKYTDAIIIGNPNATKTIEIGYLMDQLTPPYRIGAMSIAVKDGQAKGLLKGYNFR
jgi:hypothetical protein